MATNNRNQGSDNNMSSGSKSTKSDTSSGIGSSATGSSGISSHTGSTARSTTSSSSSGMNASASGAGGQQASADIGTQGAGMQQQQTGAVQNQNASGNQALADAIPYAVGQVIDSMFRTLQPRVHEAVTQFATRAVTNSSPQHLLASARRSPWYTVGGVALLVVGLGLVFGLENRSESGTPELH